MTRDQKERLVFAVMSQVAQLAEFWGDMSKVYNIEDLDQKEALQVVANWMAKLPGTVWDTRLPQPK